LPAELTTQEIWSSYQFFQQNCAQNLTKCHIESKQSVVTIIAQLAVTLKTILYI